MSQCGKLNIGKYGKNSAIKKCQYRLLKQQVCKYNKYEYAKILNTSIGFHS